MGVATLMGGLLGHSFKYALAPGWKIPGWITSMLAVMLIERSAIEYARPLIREKAGKFFLWLNIVEFFVLMSLAIALLEFNFVLGHSAYGLGIVVGGFHLFTYLKTGSDASKRMLHAVFIAAAGALFYINQWYLSVWFNHLDIGHVTMAGGAWFFYLGALQMKENEKDHSYSSNSHSACQRI